MSQTVSWRWTSSPDIPYKRGTHPKFQHSTWNRPSQKKSSLPTSNHHLPEAISPSIHGTGISTYIWLIFMVNVSKYTIHGSYGYTNFRSVASLVWPHTNRPMTTRTGPRIALLSNSPCVDQAPQPVAAEKGVLVCYQVARDFRGDRCTFHQVESAP